MRFALCNEVFNDRSLADGFRAAAEIGYTGIELAPFTLRDPAAPPTGALTDVRELSGATRDAIRAAADDAGLEVVGLHWLFAHTSGFHLTSPEASVRDQTAEYLAALATLCRDVGGDVLVLGSPQQRSRQAGVCAERATANATAVLRAAMPAFEDRGVTLALEPLGPSETDYLNTAAESADLIARVDSPACRLLLDIKAMSSESVSMPELVRQHRDHLVHFHANDPNLLGPGMGDVDPAPPLEALAEVGYSGWVSVEPFRYEPTADHVAQQSLANLRAATAP